MRQNPILATYGYFSITANMVPYMITPVKRKTVFQSYASEILASWSNLHLIDSALALSGIS